MTAPVWGKRCTCSFFPPPNARPAHVINIRLLFNFFLLHADFVFTGILRLDDNILTLSIPTQVGSLQNLGGWTKLI